MHPKANFIALCGNPTAGKDEVAKILTRLYGVIQRVDGAWLRELAIEIFPISRRQAYTQEGKLEEVTICGRKWQVRKVLGRIGKVIEHEFGDDVIPEAAVRASLREHGYEQPVCFSSVRMNQGAVYQRFGGIVVGIRRPSALPTGNDFDVFNEEIVDHWIDNDGTLEDLEAKVAAIFDPILPRVQALAPAPSYMHGNFDDAPAGEELEAIARRAAVSDEDDDELDDGEAADPYSRGAAIPAINDFGVEPIFTKDSALVVLGAAIGGLIAALICAALGLL